MSALRFRGRAAFLVLLAVPAILAACGPQGLAGAQPGGSAAATADEPTLPARGGAVARTVPASTRLAVAAVVARMQGKSEAEIERRLGASGAGRIAAPAGSFRYQGFAVRSIVHQPAPPPREGVATALALVGFQDRLGRSASAQVAVRYSAAGRRLAIESGGWRPLPALTPRVSLYVVPAAAMEPELVRRDASWERLYLAARRHGLPMRQAQALPRAPADLVVMAFWRDALPRGATVSLGASADRRGLAMASEATRHRVFPGGFVVSAMPARFAPGGDAPVWIKAAYAPGPSAGPQQQQARLVGLYGLGGAAAGR
ncbi:MAG: hypothetical protein IT557_03945 [Alphaproteobacteria bacterium]|nr:hypothetical protein [Alphaproteobacteria bacterium]